MIFVRAENVFAHWLSSPCLRKFLRRQLMTIQPLPACTVDVGDHAIGHSLSDPYRGMEGTDNAEFQTWLRQQEEFTWRKLDQMSTVAAWRTRLKSVSARGVTYRYQLRVADQEFSL